jgi:hypothetical protein
MRDRSHYLPMSRPPPSLSEPEDEYLEIARGMVDEALADYEGQLAGGVLEAMRAELTDRLLGTEAGRQLLRQVRPDPAVHASGDVVAAGAEVEGAGAPKKRAAGDGEGSA